MGVAEEQRRAVGVLPEVLQAAVDHQPAPARSHHPHGGVPRPFLCGARPFLCGARPFLCRARPLLAAQGNVPFRATELAAMETGLLSQVMVCVRGCVRACVCACVCVRVPEGGQV